MVAVTGPSAASLRRVAKFLLPRGRPAGFPLLPLANLVCLGGLPGPTLLLPLFRFFVTFAISLRLPALRFQSFKVQAGLNVYRFYPERFLKPANHNIRIVAVDFNPISTSS